MRKWVALIVSMAMLACAVPAVTTGAGTTEPIRILAIGNSYSNNATQFTEFIAETLDEDVNVEVYSLYYAGCSLAQHVNFYTENKQVYELYRKGKNINGTSVLITMQDAFDLYDYDYITVQQAPGRASTFSTYWTEAKPYLTQLQDIIKQNQPQAQIKVHQTWSFNHYCAIGNDPYYTDKRWDNTKLMFADIKESYELAAAKLGLTTADIIPVGTAIQLAKDQFGYGDFYNESGIGRVENGALYEDSISHLNVRGRYLAACVWLEYFFGVDCRTATYVQSALTEADCVVLRKIAHEVVTGETDTIVGDWRVLPNGEGVKIMHYVGNVPANGTVTIPETIGGKSVNAIAATIFKYVDGLERIVLPTSAETWEMEEGCFPVEPYDVATGTVSGNGSLSFSVDGGVASAALVEVAEGTIVTVTAAPADGYLLVPGSLTYTTASGKTVSILNKTLDMLAETFGEGSGNVFEFVMPAEQISVNATFASTASTDFAFDTIGSSVHMTDDMYDGVRFLTRLNFGEFDETAEKLTVKYNGKTYTVTGIGMLLKRAENTLDLTLENYADNQIGVNKLWNAVAYDKASSDLLKVVDYTDSYIDVQVMMMKADSISFAKFKNRQFSARGYVVLTDENGAQTVLYSATTLTKCVKDIVPSRPLAPEFGDIELQ